MRRVFPIVKERARGVVSGIGIGAIPARPVGFVHHQPVRMRRGKGRPAFHHGGQLRQLAPGMRADNPLPKRLLPPALGLPIIHDHVGMAQQARDAKGQGLPIQPRIEHHAGVAERPERYQHRHAADTVVHDLMPHEVTDRIGARRLVRQGHTHHRFTIRQSGFCANGNETGVGLRRNAVFRRTARDDFGEVNLKTRKIGVWPGGSKRIAPLRQQGRWPDQRHSRQKAAPVHQTARNAVVAPRAVWPSNPRRRSRDSAPGPRATTASSAEAQRPWVTQASG